MTPKKEHQLIHGPSVNHRFDRKVEGNGVNWYYAACGYVTRNLDRVDHPYQGDRPMCRRCEPV